MPGNTLPYHQNVSQVSGSNGAQPAMSVFRRNVQFGSSRDDTQEAFEQAGRACRTALFLTDPYVDREKLISRKGTKVAGTCEWITQNESYQSWLHGSARLLWISGGHGRGKTMLSIFLTDELEKIAQDKKEAELVFYFCDHQDEKRNTAITVLRGLVHQILTKRPRLIRHALPYFETEERIQQTLSSLEALWIIFKRTIEDPDLGVIFCILDGLEECNEDGVKVLLVKILNLFSPKTLSHVPNTFRLAIVSRDILGLQGCVRLRLDHDNNAKVAGDIKRFTSARVDRLSRIEGINDKIKATVKKTLLQHSEGTFLWVGFALNELSQKQTCSQVLKALDDLPSGLPAMYSRMLLQIPSEHRQISLKILRWVAMAFRPLLLLELAAAVGIQSSSHLISTERAICDKISLFGHFFKVRDREVSFIHPSAREYLFRKERDGDTTLEEFRIKPEKAHLEVAQTCLDYFIERGLRYTPQDLDNRRNTVDSPLLQYAMLYWPEHARDSSALATELFDRSNPFFRRYSIIRMHWCAMYRRAKGCYLPTSLSVLHIACYFGIVSWATAMLKTGASWSNIYSLVRQKSDKKTSALHWAVEGGHEAVMQLLVDGGVDMTEKDNKGWTVLHRVTQRGHEAALQLLVKGGVDVNAKDNNEWTALHMAAERGLKAIVQLLVDSGANVNAKINDGWTALHRAALEGHDLIIQVLVDSGADINMKINDGLTALHSAALRGHEAAVQVLVGGKADINAKDNNGWTALHGAVQGEHKAIVQELINGRADVNAKDNNRRTALHRAAEGGHEAIVRMLVNGRADIDVKNDDGCTALHNATHRGHETIVQVLVNSGADVNVSINGGFTALHMAAGGGHQAIVQVLVDAGADVNAKSDNRWTALHIATQWGHETIARVLVDNGADVNTMDNDRWTVLHSAAHEGYEAILRLLVDNRADLNTRDNYGRTVTYIAALRGNATMIQVLLDSGADVNMKNNNGWTALHKAAERGHGAVVQLLVNSGADVNAKVNYEWTALYLAVQRGCAAAVKALVNGGADVNARINNNSWTALHCAARGGHQEIVRVLLDGGADVNVKINNEWTALHSAALEGYGTIVQVLIDGGADVSAKDGEGKSALYWAEWRGHKAVVRLLNDISL